AIHAGDLVGTNSGLAAAVDFGVWNFNKTLSGLLDTCVAEYDQHADAPLQYYGNPLGTTLYGLVNRTGIDKDGKIDYDVSGTLSGDWVLSSSSNAFSDTSQQLAFVYEPISPAELRIVIGGTIGSAAV